MSREGGERAAPGHDAGLSHVVSSSHILASSASCVMVSEASPSPQPTSSWNDAVLIPYAESATTASPRRGPMPWDLPMTLTIINRSIPGWGMTCGPPGDGPFPGVTVLHGSEGAWSGYSHRTAAILAAHGFLAFPFGSSRGDEAWNAGDTADVPPRSDRGGDRRAARPRPVQRRRAAPGTPRPTSSATPSSAPPGASAVIPDGGRGTRARGLDVAGSSEDLLPTVPIGIERHRGAL